VSFPCDSHSAAVFDSHMPCLSHAGPLPCHEYAVLKATSQGHGTGAAWERHGMCELASAVQRRHVGDLPAFGTVGEWQGRGRFVAGSRQGNGIGTAWEWHGMCELAFTAAEKQQGNGKERQGTAGEQHGNGRGTAWERHGMFELVFNAAGKQQGNGRGTARNGRGTAWYV
jgi:hypothetical protein